MDVEATVTTSTATKLKLTAKWPMAWLQVGGSTTILHRLPAGEVFENPAGPYQEKEIGNYQPRPDLRLGDRVIVRLHWPSGST
jgi:hypothetical protein